MTDLNWLKLFLKTGIDTAACIFRGNQRFQHGKDGFCSGSLSIQSQQWTQRSYPVGWRFCILLVCYLAYSRRQSPLPLCCLAGSRYARTSVSVYFGVSSPLAQDCFVLNPHKHTSPTGKTTSPRHRCSGLLFWLFRRLARICPSTATLT